MVVNQNTQVVDTKAATEVRETFFVDKQNYKKSQILLENNNFKYKTIIILGGGNPYKSSSTNSGRGYGRKNGVH